MLVSSALVMLMTPGLALFYGGLARSKNVLGTIMQSFMMLGVISDPVRYHRLHAGLWSRPRWHHRRFLLYRSEGRFGDRARRLRADDHASDVHDLPAHVRRDHAGADYRRFRRAREVQHFHGLHAALGHAGLRPGGALGLGWWLAGSGRHRARSTSPAARSSTSTPAWRRSPRRSFTASATTSAGSRWSLTTSRWW